MWEHRNEVEWSVVGNDTQTQLGGNFVEGFDVGNSILRAPSVAS